MIIVSIFFGLLLISFLYYAKYKLSQSSLEILDAVSSYLCVLGFCILCCYWLVVIDWDNPHVSKLSCVIGYP